MNATLAPCLPCSKHPTEDGNWRPYLEHKARFPSLMCLAKLSVLQADFKGSVLDLGAGTMAASRFYLENGFSRVVAVDRSPETRRFAEALKSDYGHRFDFIQAAYKDLDFASESFSMIHSDFALPYHGPEGFDGLMKSITSWLAPSGVFACIFFGDHDGWSSIRPRVKFVTHAELDSLLAGLSPSRQVTEIENYAGLYDGTPKFWHYFRVIAKKPDEGI